VTTQRAIEPPEADPGLEAAVKEKAAQAIAEKWLELIDAGRYGASWTEAATSFKKAFDQPAWEKTLHAARSPLGKVKSRSLESRMFTKTIPGAPEGEYVVITFDTSFAHKRRAIETVTPMKDSDGSWRVSGYLIK
jgi:hypothetical protein